MCPWHRWGAVVIRVSMFMHTSLWGSSSPRASGACVDTGFLGRLGHGRTPPTTHTHTAHFLEFIQVNSLLIIPVLQFTENNQNSLLSPWRRLTIVSPFFQLYIYGLQTSLIFVNSGLLINSGAWLELPTPTLSSTFSNNLILGPVELLGCFPGINIDGIMFLFL